MTSNQAYIKAKTLDYRDSSLEKIIATNAYTSYLYAVNILKGRFEECEKNLSKNSYYSYLYTINVLKTAFPLVHNIIFESRYCNKYLIFLKEINYDVKEIHKEYGEWLI